MLAATADNIPKLDTEKNYIAKFNYPVNENSENDINYIGWIWGHSLRGGLTLDPNPALQWRLVQKPDSRRCHQ